MLRNSEIGFNSLSIEVMGQVFLHLDINDVASNRFVNKHFYNAATAFRDTYIRKYSQTPRVKADDVNKIQETNTRLSSLANNGDIAILPNELLFSIFSYLRVADLSAALSVSKRFYDVATDNQLWNPQFKLHFPHLANKKGIHVYTAFREATQYEYYESNNRKIFPFIKAKKKNKTNKEIFPLVKSGDLDKLIKAKLTLADLDRVDSNGTRLFEWAKINHHQHILNHFFEQFSENNTSDNGILLALQLNQNYERIVSCLSRPGSERMTFFHTQLHPIHIAAREGRLDVIKFLVARHPAFNPIDRFGQTPMIWAASKGHLDIINYLLETMSDPKLDAQSRGLINKQVKYNGYTALHWAAAYGHTEIVAALLKAGAKPTLGSGPLYQQYCAIHLAAQNGHLGVVQILVEQNAAILNKTDARGDTPLTWAACNGHFHIVQYLLEKGSDFDTLPEFCLTRPGRSALHWAAYHNHTEMVKTLLKHNASPLIAASGKTPDQLCTNTYIKNLILLEKLIRKLSKCEQDLLPENTFGFFRKPQNIHVVATLTAAIALKKIALNDETMELDAYMKEFTHGELGSIYQNLSPHLPKAVRPLAYDR